jgi:hypothetical protein
MKKFRSYVQSISLFNAATESGKRRALRRRLHVRDFKLTIPSACTCELLRATRISSRRAFYQTDAVMLKILQVVTLMLIALAMVPAVAHALEFPGKMRLSKDAYLTVQRIYYPGFTIAGLAESFSIVAGLALVIVTPRGSIAFLLSLTALILLLAMHAVYWIVTAPVNKVWLKDEQQSKAGAAFFRMNTSEQRQATDWTSLRDRWEYSHVTRAVLVTTALGLLACAMAIS